MKRAILIDGFESSVSDSYCIIRSEAQVVGASGIGLSSRPCLI
jgi:hypothetical protein